MASGPFLHAGAWTTRVTANDSTQQEELGALRFENGKVFKYVKTGATVAQYDAVKYSGTTGTTVIPTAAATDSVAGVAETALTSAYYGWITIYGKATCKTAVATVVAGSLLQASGTAGTLQQDLVTTAAADICGMSLDTGVATGSAIIIRCL